jgi:iron-sulfur cluster assembly accessory protein
MNAITLTQAAQDHITATLEKMDKPYLVFGLKGGGCAGFEYFWEPSTEEQYTEFGTPERDEFVELANGRKFVVDCTSLIYLIGSTIDYQNDFISSQLTVSNPNAKGGCGCGTSISV